MKGKDIKYIAIENLQALADKVTFIGSREKGAFSGKISNICLALTPSDPIYKNGKAWVSLTPSILFDAALEFLDDPAKLNGYLSPINYNSERLRREIVQTLNQPNASMTASGKWYGKLTQWGNDDFRFSLDLNLADGKVTGVSFIEREDLGRAKMEVAGEISGDGRTLRLRETKLLEGHGNWILKQMKLQLMRQPSGDFLNGAWTGMSMDGTIVLSNVGSF